MKLTKMQMLTLEQVSKGEMQAAAHISTALGHARYWSIGKLNALTDKGLVYETYPNEWGATGYDITDAGRAALEDKPK